MIHLWHHKITQYLSSKMISFAIIAGLIGIGFEYSIPTNVSAQPAGISWSKEEIIATINSDQPQTYFPVIAADNYGSTHIFWTEENAIYYIHKDEAGWTLPIDIEYSREQSFTFPSTVIDQNGILHLVWYAYGEVYYKHVPAWEATNLHNWSATRTIAVIGGSSTPLRIGVDLNNNLHIILSDWIGRSGETTKGDVYHFYSSDHGQNWTRLVKVSAVSNGELATDPRMAFDDQGNVHIAWAQMAPNLSGRQQGIYYARLSDQWERPTLPQEIASNEQNENWLMGANIAVSRDNTVHLVWVCGMQAHRCQSWSTDGGVSWSSPQQIFENLLGLSGWDVMVNDGAGNLFLITDLRYPQAMYYSYWNGEGWQDPPLIASTDPYMKLGENIMAAVGLNNQIHVVVQLGNVISYMSGRTTAPAITPAQIPTPINLTPTNPNNSEMTEAVNNETPEQSPKVQTSSDAIRLGSSELQIILLSGVLVLLVNIVIGLIFFSRRHS